MRACNMSKLRFNGTSHEISLLDRSDRVVGTWTAYNNTDSHATLRHVPNGTYTVQDTTTPHEHSADPNGPYGSDGIVRFDVPAHARGRVQAGRANARQNPGPQHPTMGCLRTTDEAMRNVRDLMATDPLTTIEVTANSPASSDHGRRRHGHHAHAHP